MVAHRKVEGALLESDVQLLPFRIQKKETEWIKKNTCVFEWALKKHNHKAALDCASRLDF